MRTMPSAALTRAAPLLLVLSAACAERATIPEVDPPFEPVAALDCTASVRSGTVTCSAVEGGPSLSVSPIGGGPRRLIVGGQGVNVRLASSNVRYDAASHAFSADVTVQNLLPEALGTGDGWATLTGVRVFFHQDPSVTLGAGSVRVANADGEGLFTGSQQPYFAYDEVLPPNAVSAAKTWTWTVDPGVSTFAFQLYVDADKEDDAPGTGKWRSVSVGTAHACALRPSGDAYCWGAGPNGQLGNGTQGFASAPVPVAGGRHWTSIAAGNQGTCGTDVGGDTWCWGHFSTATEVDGDPGCPGGADPCLPVRVLGADGFHLVSAGLHHACAVARSGEAYCWGVDAEGQLGSSLNADTCYFSSATPCALRPVAVDGGLRFNDVVAGTHHSCALERGGDAYCWGYGNGGLRGDGTNATAGAPVPVAGGLKFSMVDLFSSHACGLTPDGQAWCWGGNSRGELGIEDITTTHLVPKAVRQGELKFRKVVVGDDHTCALERTGEAWCWGGNLFGQLGDGAGGDWAYSTVPVPVAGGRKFRDLDAGGMFTCGIAQDGEAWCWGHNISGSGAGGPGVPPERCHWEPCTLVPAKVPDPTT
jgi:alpha-tubulin suppressor-like RCC1 family protein